MNPTLLAGVLAVLVSGLTSGVTYAVAQRNLRARAPQSRAETESIASATARAEVQQALDTLRHDLGDARKRAKEAEAAASAYRVELELLKKRLDSIEDELTEAHDQNAILAKQLDTAQETVKHVQKQNDMLLGYFAAYQKWEQRWYDAGHPEGVERPPVIDLNKLANP